MKKTALQMILESSKKRTAAVAAYDDYGRGDTYRVYVRETNK